SSAGSCWRAPPSPARGQQTCRTPCWQTRSMMAARRSSPARPMTGMRPRAADRTGSAARVEAQSNTTRSTALEEMSSSARSVVVAWRTPLPAPARGGLTWRQVLTSSVQTRTTLPCMVLMVAGAIAGINKNFRYLVIGVSRLTPDTRESAAAAASSRRRVACGSLPPVLRTHTKKGDHIRRAGILFAGGPAPSANAVISSAAISFLEDGRQVVGFFHGYSNLQDYHPVSRRLLPDEHYRVFEERDLRGLRNSRGVIIGTARSNPGKPITQPADLDDPEKTQRLRNVYNALVDLEIDALISIGGDDTLKTANLLHEFQNRLPAGARRVRVIHLPKTIDNDYRGIDFTFGFFTAVDVMAKEVQNLRADAIATSGYFIIETMGRKAGWLSYGVAIAGEANLVIATEDVRDDLCIEEETVDPATGEKRVDKRLSMDALADRIVDLILTRERRGKHYGTVVLAEGLAELMPQSYLQGLPRDDHGHISLGRIDLSKLVAQLVSDRYE